MKVESLAALSSRPKGSKLKGESRKKLMADSWKHNGSIPCTPNLKESGWKRHSFHPDDSWDLNLKPEDIIHLKTLRYICLC
jgi:hypothetical protein